MAKAQVGQSAVQSKKMRGGIHAQSLGVLTGRLDKPSRLEGLIAEVSPFFGCFRDQRGTGNVLACAPLDAVEYSMAVVDGDDVRRTVDAYVRCVPVRWHSERGFANGENGAHGEQNVDRSKRHAGRPRVIVKGDLPYIAT